MALTEQGSFHLAYIDPLKWFVVEITSYYIILHSYEAHKCVISLRSFTALFVRSKSVFYVLFKGHAHIGTGPQHLPLVIRCAILLSTPPLTGLPFVYEC